MHELVKRGVKISMEQDGKDSSTQHEKSAIDAMAALFSFLVKNAIISDYQVAKGVSRLHKILDDLKLEDAQHAGQEGKTLYIRGMEISHVPVSGPFDLNQSFDKAKN